MNTVAQISVELPAALVAARARHSEAHRLTRTARTRAQLREFVKASDAARDAYLELLFEFTGTDQAKYNATMDALIALES